MPGVKYFQGSSIYLSEKTVAYAGQPLESAPIRLGAGAATALEVLDAEQSLAAQEEKLALSLKNARQIQQLRHLRCQAGSSPLTAWLDAQENRRMAKGNLLENGLNQLQNHITCVSPKAANLKNGRQDKLKAHFFSCGFGSRQISFSEDRSLA